MAPKGDLSLGRPSIYYNKLSLKEGERVRLDPLPRLLYFSQKSFGNQNYQAQSSTIVVFKNIILLSVNWFPWQQQHQWLYHCDVLTFLSTFFYKFLVICVFFTFHDINVCINLKTNLFLKNSFSLLKAVYIYLSSYKRESVNS